MSDLTAPEWGREPARVELDAVEIEAGDSLSVWVASLGDHDGEPVGIRLQVTADLPMDAASDLVTALVDMGARDLGPHARRRKGGATS